MQSGLLEERQGNVCGNAPAVLLAASEQGYKIFHRQLCLLQYVRKGRSLDRAMRWDGYLEHLGRSVLLEADMTAALPDNHPAIALESMQ